MMHQNKLHFNMISKIKEYIKLKRERFKENRLSLARLEKIGDIKFFTFAMKLQNLRMSPISFLSLTLKYFIGFIQYQPLSGLANIQVYV